MFKILVFVSALVGAFCFGFKVAQYARERRKSDALDYIRGTGLHPPIYSGYTEQHQQPQQQPKSGGASLIDQILFIGIVCAVAYVFWCGLT